MERSPASNAPSALSRTPTRADESTAGEAKGVSTRGLLAAETYLFRIVGREQKHSIDATAPSQVARSDTLDARLLARFPGLPNGSDPDGSRIAFDDDEGSSKGGQR